MSYYWFRCPKWTACFRNTGLVGPLWTTGRFDLDNFRRCRCRLPFSFRFFCNQDLAAPPYQSSQDPFLDFFVRLRQMTTQFGYLLYFCPAVCVLSISILTALLSSELKHAKTFSAFVNRRSGCESLITRLVSSAADEAVSCCCIRPSIAVLPTKLDFIGVRPSDELSMIIGLWAVPLLHMNSSSSSILSWYVCRATSFCGSLSHKLIPDVFCVVEWANFPSPQKTDGFCLKFSKGQFYEHKSPILE